MSFGLVEWFDLGDRAGVERALPLIRASGASWLRTHLSWADWHRPEGPEWYGWLIPKLAEVAEVLPCLHFTPPSLSRTGRVNGPPRNPRDYADFAEDVLTRLGRHFPAVELWNEPNNLLDWDWREDPEHRLFCQMVGGAAYWVRRRGWKAVLGGPCPFDPRWLDLMGQRGVLAECDAVGFHGFPGTWDSDTTWQGWDRHLADMRAVLDRHAPKAQVWVTETGHSAWRGDGVAQVRQFAQAMQAPADRVYWYALRDLPATKPGQEGLWFDPRHYHLGIHDAAGRPRLLARLLAEGGPDRVAQVAALTAPRLSRPSRPVVITGGAGFIGSNLADALASEGREVLILDTLSRPGVETNLAWLADRHPDRIHPAPVDLRDAAGLAEAVRDAAEVVHLAAQTAVTTSLSDPAGDFRVNAEGTLNLLESLRATGRRVPLVHASTNKVYGDLADLPMSGPRHEPADPRLRRRGLDETRPLQFRTPYGCSKGAADQYVLDWAQGFGMPAAVLRMSCVHGPRQFGTEDQGWVAHFLIRALEGRPITVFGDGRQVRDILHVSDAVAAYRAVLANMDTVSGRAFNLGGGPSNAVSLRDVLEEIARLGSPPRVIHAETRPGDQPWFVADTAALSAATGWRARIGWREGLADLARWLRAERGLTPERLRA